jgi:hypothetical protein
MPPLLRSSQVYLDDKDAGWLSAIGPILHLLKGKFQIPIFPMSIMNMMNFKQPFGGTFKLRDCSITAIFDFI